MNTEDREWEVRTLKNWGMEAQSGFASGVHNQTQEGVAHLRPMNVSRNGIIDLAEVKYVAATAGKHRLEHGDILFNNTNSDVLVGKTALFSKEGEYAFSNHMTRLRFPKESVHPKFMASRLHSLWIEGFFKSICNNHVSQASVSTKTLMDLEIALPPLEEQRQIVNALDDHLSRLDKALAELDYGLIASDIFTRSVLKAAFAGQLTNSEEPSGWENARIGDVVDFAPKKPNHLKASKDECSFLPMAAVQELTGAIYLGQTISHEKALAKTLTFFNEGDVLFAKVTPCMENGKIAVARGLTNQMGYGSTEFHVLSPKESLLADYLRYFLVSKDFRVNAASAMTGAVGLRRVPKSYLEEHHIPLPSIDNQQKVVRALDFQLSTVDQLKVSIYGHISKIAGLRRSLLNSAFMGKLLVEGISE